MDAWRRCTCSRRRRLAREQKCRRLMLLPVATCILQKPLPAAATDTSLRSAEDNPSEKDTSQTRCQIHDTKELSRDFEFDRRECQSREQPAVDDENSEKNTSPNAGIPLFAVASGISLRQREAFVVCRATTTISQHQHGNRCGFQSGGNILDRANTCKMCNQQRNGGLPRPSAKRCAADSRSNRGWKRGWKEHERFRLDCCWLGESELWVGP